MPVKAAQLTKDQLVARLLEQAGDCCWCLFVTLATEFGVRPKRSRICVLCELRLAATKAAKEAE